MCLPAGHLSIGSQSGFIDVSFLCVCVCVCVRVCACVTLCCFFFQMAQPPLKRRIEGSPDAFYSSDSRSSLDSNDEPDCTCCLVMISLHV